MLAVLTAAVTVLSCLGAVDAEATTPPAPPMSVAIAAEHLDSAGAWTTVLAAQPGERLRVLISYANSSASIERGVQARVTLPIGAVMNGRVTLTNALTPLGENLSPTAISHRGVNLGDYAPGANSYLTFYLRLPNAGRLRCGVTPLVIPLTVTVGTSKAQSVLHLHAHRDCPTSVTPVAMPPQ